MTASPALASDRSDSQHDEVIDRLNSLERAIQDLQPKRKLTFTKEEKEQGNALLKRLMDDVAKKQAASGNCTGLCPSGY